MRQILGNWLPVAGTGTYTILEIMIPNDENWIIDFISAADSTLYVPRLILEINGSREIDSAVYAQSEGQVLNKLVQGGTYLKLISNVYRAAPGIIAGLIGVNRLKTGE